MVEWVFGSFQSPTPKPSISSSACVCWSCGVLNVHLIFGSTLVLLMVRQIHETRIFVLNYFYFSHQTVIL